MAVTNPSGLLRDVQLQNNERTEINSGSPPHSEPRLEGRMTMPWNLDSESKVQIKKPVIRQWQGPVIQDYGHFF